MSSFKLEKGGKPKEQARSAGLFAAVLGLLTGLFIHPLGFVLAALGLVFFIASFAASK